MNDGYSQQYQITKKKVGPFVVMFMSSEGRRKDERVSPEGLQGFAVCSTSSNYVVTEYLDFATFSKDLLPVFTLWFFSGILLSRNEYQPGR
jgi:hypothetical protein